MLRGPQGSLFGRNTTAGIIKFDTFKPTQTFDRPRERVGTAPTARSISTRGVGGPLIADKSGVPRLGAVPAPRRTGSTTPSPGASADGTATPQKNAMGGFDERNVRLQLLLTPAIGFSVACRATPAGMTAPRRCSTARP